LQRPYGSNLGMALRGQRGCRVTDGDGYVRVLISSPSLSAVDNGYLSGSMGDINAPHERGRLGRRVRVSNVSDLKWWAPLVAN
jgi:hypothetical protein